GGGWGGGRGPRRLRDWRRLGPTLCDRSPAVPHHANVGSDRAARARPTPAAPTPRIEPPRRGEAPEVAPRPDQRDTTPAPRETAAGGAGPAPAPRRLRR